MTLGDLTLRWPIYLDNYNVGFRQDKNKDYRVELADGGNLIHLQGPLGFGIAKQVERVIAANPTVRGIILDSRGGYVYESRELSRIILTGSLNTYSLKGCYSACGLAFISGNERYLGLGANLAFHKYTNTAKGIHSYLDMDEEQKKDLIVFERRGISREFIDRIFKAENDDLWYPTIDEMRDAGVIHEVVDPSSLVPKQHRSRTRREIVETFRQIAAYRAIEKYKPTVFQDILDEMEELLNKGASEIEGIRKMTDWMHVISDKVLPTTSDDALILMIQATSKVLAELEEKKPILCIKSLLPAQYGALESQRHVSETSSALMMKALDRVIVDSFEAPNTTAVDSAAAEGVLLQVVSELGDDAEFLSMEGLENKEEYSKACKAVIRYYTLILQNETGTAANTLRYSLAP
jgi:hypothetical protein